MAISWHGMCVRMPTALGASCCHLRGSYHVTSQALSVALSPAGGAGPAKALLQIPGFTDQPHPARTPVVRHVRAIPHEVHVERLRPAHGGCPHNHGHGLLRIR